MSEVALCGSDSPSLSSTRLSLLQDYKTVSLAKEQQMSDQPGLTPYTPTKIEWLALTVNPQLPYERYANDPYELSSFRRITTPCRSSFGIYPLYTPSHTPAIHGHSLPATPGR